VAYLLAHWTFLAFWLPSQTFCFSLYLCHTSVTSTYKRTHVHAHAHRHKWIRNPHHVRCRVCCGVVQCVLRLHASRTVHMQAYTHTHTWTRGHTKDQGATQNLSCHNEIHTHTITQTRARAHTHTHTNKARFMVAYTQIHFANDHAYDGFHVSNNTSLSAACYRSHLTFVSLN